MLALGPAAMFAVLVILASRPSPAPCGRTSTAATDGATAGELALMGAITGLPVGAAQAFPLRDRVARSWVWAVAMPLLWALGWTVTAAAGVGVDRQ